MYLFLTSVLMDHCKLGGFKQWTLTILQLQKPALGWGTQGVGRAGSSQKLQAKTQPLLLPASGSCPKPQLLPASLQSLLPLSLPPLPHGLSFPLEREPCDYVDGPLRSSRWTSACGVQEKSFGGPQRQACELDFLQEEAGAIDSIYNRLLAREKSKPMSDCHLPGKGLGSGKTTGILDTLQRPRSWSPPAKKSSSSGRGGWSRGKDREGQIWGWGTQGTRKRAWKSSLSWELQQLPGRPRDHKQGHVPDTALGGLLPDVGITGMSSFS